jgi:hypothetical protein
MTMMMTADRGNIYFNAVLNKRRGVILTCLEQDSEQSWSFLGNTLALRGNEKSLSV